MPVLIYLDQNILSDLRGRKLEGAKNDNFKRLKDVILASNAQIIYSDITLSEINQIPRDDYKIEHIDLLAELSAKHLPSIGNIREESPHRIWSDYLQNELDNGASGITQVIQIQELFSRKLSGLKVEESFSSLRETLQRSLYLLLKDAPEQLNSVDIDTLDESEKRQLIGLKNWLPDLLAKIDHMPLLDIPEYQELGPKPFRASEQVHTLNVMGLSPDRVVKSIEAIFSIENSAFDWGEYFDGKAGNIAKAYSLMNWAGYYPDDFDKKHDRFRASNNDMQHAIKASICHFLISSDVAFRMKAIASYHYAGVETIVTSPEDFLMKYCTTESQNS